MERLVMSIMATLENSVTLLLQILLRVEVVTWLTPDRLVMRNLAIRQPYTIKRLTREAREEVQLLQLIIKVMLSAIHSVG